MFEQLKEILVDEMQIKEELISYDAELVNDLGMNSIELSELVLACEERFSIEIDEERAKGEKYKAMLEKVLESLENLK